MRPFFSFYGGKWRSVKYYPHPKHDVIVEPFAGSAGYSVRYAEHKIILCDLDPTIAGLWRYLIGVSTEEILSLPDLKEGQKVKDLDICDEAKSLIGFWLDAGQSRPRQSRSKWGRSGDRLFWGSRVRERVASQLEKIRHWEIYNCSYRDLPFHGEATWFIDPPYEIKGKYYRFTGLDYKDLAMWSKDRIGQKIVCENEGASWMDFIPLREIQSTMPGRTSKEAVWING